MKKIFSFSLMLMGAVALLSSCSDDRDSNPTLIEPAVLQLNETNWRGSIIELENTTNSLQLSWSQPVYTEDNAPLIVSYSVDVSPKGSFTKAYDASAEDNTDADYMTLANGLTDCTVNFSAAELNRMAMQVCGWTDASDLPISMQLVFRVNAAVLTAVNEPLFPITSNVVSINVIPYFTLLTNADPEIWYLLGSDIADGSWGDVIGEKTIPMQTIEGVNYDSQTGQGKIQWTGYLAGNGFKLRGSLTDAWATQWGQGAAFGEFVKNDGGSGNITVPAPGVYTVTLYTDANLAIAEGQPELSVVAYDGTATVFSGMAISGSFNDWTDTPMLPSSTAFENHDWYLEYTFNAGDEVKVKQADSWDFNKGGSFVEYEEGLYVYGQTNGDNLVIPEAGTYTILFNDITGYIRFIKKAEE